MYSVETQSRFIFLLAIVCVVIQVARAKSLDEHDDPVDRRWREFKSKYNKSYESPEAESVGFENFMENLRKVVNHNANSKQFRMDINHMSDWSDSDYQKLNNFVKPTRRIELGLEDVVQQKDYNAPSSVDYRTDDRRVGPVKDQGDCGACWAFATVGLLEGQQRMNSTGYVMSLSEQNLIDCDTGGNNHGCTGGNYEDALAFIKSNGGLEVERDYPYASQNGKDNFECKYKEQNAFITTRHLINSVKLVEGDETSLKENVASYGPIAVSIDTSLDSFRHYKSGVYYDRGCSSNQVNHGVLVVGYGTNEAGEDYWIIKNSWSKQWGLDGYALMARNRNNHCGIASYAVLSIAQRP